MRDLYMDPFAAKFGMQLRDVLLRKMPEEAAKCMTVDEVRALIATEAQAGHTAQALDLKTALENAEAALSPGPFEIHIQSPFGEGGRWGGAGGADEIAPRFGLEHLSPAAAPAVWPPPATIAGQAHRLVVCLPTSTYRGPYVNIVYVIDTGSPVTYLSRSALDALGVDAAASHVPLIINGLPDGAWRSPIQQSNVSLLGMSWFMTHGVDLTIEFHSNRVILLPRQPPTSSTPCGAGVESTQ